jgi:hypothetical protein
MGMGDAKLTGMMGLFLGRSVAVALFAALIASVLTGVALATRRGVYAARRPRFRSGPTSPSVRSWPRWSGTRSCTGICISTVDGAVNRRTEGAGARCRRIVQNLPLDPAWGERGSLRMWELQNLPRSA